MIRTSILLTDAMHARLRSLAKQQGRTLSELVHEALVRTFGEPMESERERTLHAIAGLWRDRQDLGTTSNHVRRLRRNGRPRS